MKIFMIAPEPFFEARGTPISVQQRLEGLTALGHDVDLLTYPIGQDIDLPGVRIYRLPRLPFIKAVKIGPSWAKGLLDILLAFKALQMLLFRRYDAIHTHEEAAFLGLVFGPLFGLPHVYDMHSSLPHQLKHFKLGDWWWLVRLFAFLERRVLKNCQAVITIGADLERYVRRINPHVPAITIHNVAVHTNGRLSKGRTRPGAAEALDLGTGPHIVYAGSFERYQGLELLLESAELVMRRYPKARFVLVGGQPEQVERLRRLASAQHLNDALLLIGQVQIDESLAYLDAADVLVSPRTAETSVPLKIYSYLHAGKPIVATRLAAHTQVLDEQVALLVEPNKEALAAGICACLADPEFGRQLGTSARALAEQKYGFADYLEKLAQIYARLRPEQEPKANLPKGADSARQVV
ncbi:MAG: glycosyltransferase [Candidatus Promineifilaceae bacterium]